MLQVKSVAKRFGDKVAVNDVSFTVEAGQSYGLLGPNGAGKSTTIGLICGLLKPDHGEILVAGHNIRRAPEAAKRAMGVVPQDIALYPSLSARENLLFWGALYDLSGKELQARVDEALEIVSLSDRQKERIETYSGGMKRRINIAASLLHRPKLLIMDEPTVGIDPQSRNNILETVKRLNAEGMTVLYTSHYMEEVEYLCQRLAIIDHGKLITEGSLDDVRRLVGTQTSIRLQVAGADESTVAAIAAVPGVSQAKQENGSIIALADQAAEVMGPIITAVAAAGRKITGVDVAEPNLEAVFLHLTGRALRD